MGDSTFSVNVGNGSGECHACAGSSSLALRDHAERNALAEQHRRLVSFVLNRYFSALVGADREDAESAGYLALLSAAEKWNPLVGKFSTYAVRVIFDQVGKHCTRARAQGFGGVAYVGVPAGTCFSIETPLREGCSSSGVVADHVADFRDCANVEATVTNALDRADRLAFLWRVLDHALVPRHADILRLHYREGLPLDEIAARHGESVQSIQDGHRNALLRLRASVGTDSSKSGGGSRRAVQRGCRLKPTCTFHETRA